MALLDRAKDEAGSIGSRILAFVLLPVILTVVVFVVLVIAILLIVFTIVDVLQFVFFGTTGIVEWFWKQGEQAIEYITP